VDSEIARAQAQAHRQTHRRRHAGITAFGAAEGVGLFRIAPVAIG
jgi:hypothetical protein